VGAGGLVLCLGQQEQWTNKAVKGKTQPF
jgi:hypothetical protein